MPRADHGSYRPARRRLAAALVIGAAAAALAGCGARTHALEDASRRAGDPASRFGIASGGAIEFASPRALARELDGYVALGAGWLRFDVKWEIVEARRGIYDWRRYDRVVRAARSRGIDVVATITYAPDWARPRGSDNRIRPRAYARFAAAVVRRYAPRGVRHYELWNEPNVRTFWKPWPDAAAYASLVKAAYPAMKAVDSSVTVLAGSLAPVGGARGPKCGGGVARINPIPFVQQLYAHGAGGSFDALSYHPYADEGPHAEHPCNAWRQLDETTPSLRSVMEQAGDGEKQIWATEFGAHVAEVGEAGQAQQVRDAVELWPRYRWAGPLMVYAYRDPAGKGFSLLRPDWSARPAWSAYRNALAASRTG